MNCLSLTFEPITNQNLSGSPAEDFLIITHPLFESAAQRLAQFREQQDGLKTMVVTPEKFTMSTVVDAKMCRPFATLYDISIKRTAEIRFNVW